jgi:hypothetical protein
MGDYYRENFGIDIYLLTKEIVIATLATEF